MKIRFLDTITHITKPRRPAIAKLQAIAPQLADIEKITHFVPSTPAHIERNIFEEEISEEEIFKSLAIDAPEGSFLRASAIF